MYGYLADGVVFVHVLYVAYVLVGQVAIIAAAPFKRLWAKNPWFRFTHLVAIGIVAVEAIMGWRCPLSTWEEKLRLLEGQNFDSSATFLGRLLHNLLFIEGQPEIFYTVLYLGMMILVVQGLVMYPPRRFRTGRSPADTAPQLQLA